MAKGVDGFFTADLKGVPLGEIYRFRIDDRGPFPDPASRYQPQGVHGPSSVVDPAAYRWRDSSWKGIPIKEAVFYELHVGTFTPEGSFRAAANKFPYLKDLGITAIELMPLADFPGDRNWGYDGVAPFAPARCYGTPDDLRHLVDEAHLLGLAVFVDAVYNHFGPDGAYQGVFSKHYFTGRHRTPWGDAMNFDGPDSAPVREYFVENALRWIHEYHMDGLRLDATHAIEDDSPTHILTELKASVQRSAEELNRSVHVIAEDARNLPRLLAEPRLGGMALDGVWADDFHHQMRRALAGDSDGYFADFEGTVPAIAKTVKQGWIRGGDPAGLSYSKFVYCIQNHDQIGNRALGDRLHHGLDLAAYRAATTLLLLLPQTPLLFMGQEWAASTPFRYFTSHGDDLGALVTEGRLREFANFVGFSHESIPDPQALDTFQKSKLNWEEPGGEPHASILRLYKSLLRLRRAAVSLENDPPSPKLRVEILNEDTLLLRRITLSAVIRLFGQGEVNLPGRLAINRSVWNSEDPQFARDSKPIRLDSAASKLTFARPGAMVFQNAIEEAD